MQDKFYNFGLWIGDKYVWGGSVGITNTSNTLIQEFKKFLATNNPRKEIKEITINKGNAKRVYINSWKFLKFLQKIQENIVELIKTKDQFISYISGKIDADGTIMPYNVKFRTGFIKITYNKQDDAEKDLALLRKFGLNGCILPYKKRNAFDLKFTFNSCLNLLEKLKLKHPEKKKKLILIKRLVGR